MSNICIVVFTYEQKHSWLYRTAISPLKRVDEENRDVTSHTHYDG